MATLEELPLGRDGLQYVLSSLKGARRFADALTAEIAASPAAANTVIAPVPAGTPLSRAIDFETGGLMHGGARQWLAGRLSMLCNAYGGGTFVALDTTASPSDPHIHERAVDKFFYDGLVQYFVGCADLNEASLDNVLRAVASFHFIAAFTTCPLSTADLPADLVVNDRLIARLAAGVQAVIIGAYDQESFAVWQRSV
jgi:hypothetical protein